MTIIERCPRASLYLETGGDGHNTDLVHENDTMSGLHKYRIANNLKSNNEGDNILSNNSAAIAPFIGNSGNATESKDKSDVTAFAGAFPEVVTSPQSNRPYNTTGL